MERQYDWYGGKAGWDVAEGYLAAVEAVCRLTNRKASTHRSYGGFQHPRLRDWRFFIVLHPFNRHLLFYEIIADTVIMRRAMHSWRDSLRRLVEPPEER